MRQHWDQVYSDRGTEDLAWHEPVPATLPLVLSHSRPDDPVIDAGGGASTLARHLVEHGYHDITVVDLSWSGLEHARRALGDRASPVDWVHADILAMAPDQVWSVWHDRAVFHFLTSADDRRRYREVMAGALARSGVAVIATFAPDGPERCAGLPVCRYDASSLAAEFAPDFEVVESGPLAPTLGVGDQRPYVAVVLRRGGAERRGASEAQR